MARNVLGGELQACCFSPVTGFYRDGHCKTAPDDIGTHVICAQVTQAFLEFSRSQGNDLIAPEPLYNFPGLRPGDRWCLCAFRWREAMLADAAPLIVLEATHEKALQFVPLEVLLKYALDVQ